MRVSRVLSVIAAVVLFLTFPTAVFAANPGDGGNVADFAPGQILVKFNPHVSPSDIAQIHRQYGGQVKNVIAAIGVQVVTVPATQETEKARAYSAHSAVAYAEPDYICQAIGSPDDAYLDKQWGMKKVEAPQAWDVTTGSASVNIAILDTGIDLDHPDLAAKILSSINLSDSPNADDSHGHGTHCAGIAAASTNNGVGVAGLGYDATLMNVKVLGDDGRGYYSWVANGIIWAADNGAEVISLSLGGSSPSSTLENAVNYAWGKGVVVVAAAGNNGNSDPFYPAYYANCMAVAATDSNDNLASWSNYGEWVDVAAPGVSIYSTLKDNSYGYKSGTSMAAPHVAGLAGLVFSVTTDGNANGWLNDEVRSRVEANCDDIGLSGIGSGRINAFNAVQGSSPPLNQAPVLDPIGDKAVDEAQLLQFAVSASDPDGDALTYSASNLPQGASYNNQTFTWTPNYSQAGTYEVVFTVFDGELSDSETITITVNDIMLAGEISGVVTDAADGSAIEGAAVSDGTRSAVTDASGSYAISNVPEGNYTLTCSKDGYETSSLSVMVVSGETTTADFALSKAPLKSMWVDSITFSTRGKNLRTEVKVVGDGGVVAGANVALKLENGGQTWNFTGSTDSTGRVSFMLGKAPGGDYIATITSLTYSGYEWNGDKGVTQASYTLTGNHGKPNQKSTKNR